ncbi:uncharacterized protein SPSK_04230 [Sporothrix schenckii 1099-18]|uniref:Zn(2)-C6 fungal-type domain-containing protein n=1 Tax=Sporothrix schenckii 1099-18 TaxID=1397361 RepID=A0A0F2M3H9_SPOSC|nr:uncharacterized protein SPSK_04230 [Sporothrix schenckii 1099-18]KJR83330.1 hypothetical protein SPSK_04230 [Sporothrix schenckii 1099-18]
MDGPAGRRAAKVGHRKSRNGCTKCKTRRVKCDEVRPVCSNCSRLGLDCAWPTADAPGRCSPPHQLPSPAATRRPGPHAAPMSVSQISPSLTPTSATSAASTTPHPPSHPQPQPQPHGHSHAHSQSHPLHSPGTSATGTDFGDASSGNGQSPQEHDAHNFSAMLQLWSNAEEASSSSSSSSSLSAAPSAVATDAENDCLLPESRTRRLLEHRLMQNYLYNLGVQSPASPSQDWNDLWTKTVPPLALRYDNILYAILSLSATHMLRSEPRNHTLFRARQAYLVAAMRVQRRMVDTLTLDSADAVCLASLVMLVQSFAMLDERVIDTYTPPMDWLRLGRGAGAVIWTSIEAILKTGEASKSVMLTIANAQPRMGFDESYFDASNRAPFRAVLAQDLPSGDDWADAATRDAYEKTLSYVGSLQLSMRRGEPVYVLCRRVQGFTMVMPPRFVDFVSERRPRALVVLAHFFAAVSKISKLSQASGGVWWLGGEDSREPIATREVRGIRSIMPVEWMAHMIWPMEAAGLS